MPALKTFTDIKFFPKIDQTILAFEGTPFTGSSATYPYPNANFDNDGQNSPFIDLVELQANHMLETPTSLGIATVSGTTVTGTGDLFADVEPSNYLLYRIDGEGSGTSDQLRVLGYIASKTNSNTVVLESSPPSETTGEDLEVFSWEGDVSELTLKSLNFNFADSFYMVVKNNNYTSTNHNGVLYIDTAKTASNYNNNPIAFAYSPDRYINTNYFSLQRISKVKSPDVSEIETTLIPCSIKGVSTYSEKSLFENLESIPLSTIPYWSVYLVNPHHTSNLNLDKKTFYRLTISDTLPSSQITPSISID